MMSFPASLCLSADLAGDPDAEVEVQHEGITFKAPRSKLMAHFERIVTLENIERLWRRHDPRPAKMTVSLSNGIPLVRLGQGDYTRDINPQAIHSPGVETKDRAHGTDR